MSFALICITVTLSTRAQLSAVAVEVLRFLMTVCQGSVSLFFITLLPSPNLMLGKVILT